MCTGDRSRTIERQHFFRLNAPLAAAAEINNPPLLATEKRIVMIHDTHKTCRKPTGNVITGL